MGMPKRGRLSIVGLILAALLAALLYGCGGDKAPPAGYEKVLLVVDVQEDSTGKILKPPFLYQKDSDEFISKLNRIIEAADKEGMLIVYTRMNQKLEETPGTKLDSRLRVVNQNSFLKDNLDAFSSSDRRFAEFMAGQKGVKEVYIVGLDAALCVNETAKAAVKKGYKTTVVTDALKTISEKKPEQIVDDYKSSGILTATSDQVWK